ncbi:hypothetical protein [Nocardia sp. NPDC127526]|uniref:hypothetical protein n=1 Tax=Nocardia sp. NPDC127526 TaxID=3345393 RepID=UPI00363B2263
MRSVEELDDYGGGVFTIEVDTVYKGSAARLQGVATAQSTACGWSGEVGRRYVIFGERAGDRIHTSCGAGNRPAGSALTVPPGMTAIAPEPGESGVPAADGFGIPSRFVGYAVLIATAFLLVAAAVCVGLVVRSRRRNR